MAYWQWGDATAGHVVVCAHGLSRQGRDFDVLARALVARATGPVRVVCPDVVGRGRSDWLKDPMGYQIPAYAGDMLALLAQLQPAVLDWVGTSMGGIIGMLSDRTGVRLDVRRISDVSGGEPEGFSSQSPELSFWRTSFGVTFSQDLPPSRVTCTNPSSDPAQIVLMS